MGQNAGPKFPIWVEPETDPGSQRRANNTPGSPSPARGKRRVRVVFVQLGYLGGENWSVANGVSPDGSVIVGSAGSASTVSDRAAFVWTSGGQMQNLRDLLLADGIAELDGWTLLNATGISGDGRTIVGYGVNPDGNTEAWIATIPELHSLLLLATAIGLLVIRYREH